MGVERPAGAPGPAEPRSHEPKELHPGTPGVLDLRRHVAAVGEGLVLLRRVVKPIDGNAVDGLVIGHTGRCWRHDSHLDLLAFERFGQAKNEGTGGVARRPRIVVGQKKYAHQGELVGSSVSRLGRPVRCSGPTDIVATPVGAVVIELSSELTNLGALAGDLLAKQ